MKKTVSKIVILLILAFFINVTITQSVIAEDNKIIKIDGKFEDWDDKPIINDKVGDAPISEDIKEVRYFVSDKYLFLKVKRNDNYKVKENWNFEVLMIDTPQGKKTTEFIFKEKKLVPINSTSFQISVYEIKNKGKGKYVVSVSKDKIPVETFFSASKDGKEIEFRLPLDLVGIQGPSKTIKFVIKSNLNARTASGFEFVPDSGVTLISMVPAIGSMYFQMFIFLLLVVTIYKYFLRKKLNKAFDEK